MTAPWAHQTPYYWCLWHFHRNSSPSILVLKANCEPNLYLWASKMFLILIVVRLLSLAIQKTCYLNFIKRFDFVIPAAMGWKTALFSLLWNQSFEAAKMSWFSNANYWSRGVNLSEVNRVIPDLCRLHEWCCACACHTASSSSWIAVLGPCHNWPFGGRMRLFLAWICDYHVFRAWRPIARDRDHGWP